MVEVKSHHKDLKRAVNEAETRRHIDRSFKSWYDMKTLKKITNSDIGRFITLVP